jgi:hypothetical protein
MSRRPQHQPSLDTSQPDVPEDELLSATGEGDEVMEEAEEQEGYSACQNPFPLTYSNNCRPSLPPLILPAMRCDPSHPDRCLTNCVISLTSIVDAYVILDMD